MKKFFERSTDLATVWVFRLWPAILLLTLILCAAAIPRTIHLFQNISTDPADLLPRNNPNVQTILHVKEKLERGPRASFVIESDSRAANIEMLEALAEALHADPRVSYVETRKVGYDYFDQHKLLFLDLADLRTIRDRLQRKINKEKLLGLFVDLEDAEDEFSFEDLQEKYRSTYSEGVSSPYNESDDGHVFVLNVESRNTDTGLKAAAEFQAHLETYLKERRPKISSPSVSLYLSGAAKVFEYRALMKDLKLVGMISAILLLIPLLLRYRNLLHVTWIFLPLLVGLPISFGLASFFIDKLNICTSFLFAILGALGIENGIHIFSRYYESRQEGADLKTAVRDIYRHTGRAILTSVASVAVTFLALTWSDFRGFSEFGLISGLGLWVIFGVYFTFLPSLLIFLEKMKWISFGNVRAVTKREWAFPSWLVHASLVLSVLFLIFSLSVMTFVGFEYNSKKLRADIPEVLEAQAKKRLTTKRINSPAAVIVQSEEEAKLIRDAVESHIETDRLSRTIDTTRSYYDLIPKKQSEKMKVIRQIGRLMDDKAIRLLKGDDRKKADEFRDIVKGTTPARESDLPEDLVNLFQGKPSVPGKMLYINAIPNMELDDGRNAMAFAEDIGVINTKLGTFYPSSDAIIYGKVLQTMIHDAPRVILVTFILVMLFVLLDFRSLKKTAIVMTSVLFGVIWMIGVMWIFGVKLNFYNMIIIPAVLGMSIDNSIHIFHRYQELGFGSLRRVLATSGMAAFLASVTNASAFIGLLFCTHKGLYSIGLLAVIGVTTCLLSTLVFLPGLLGFLEKVRLERRRIIP